MLHRINIALEHSQGDNLSEFLTASRWKSCDRAMWFSLRNATHIRHDAQKLRTFAFGHAVESLVIGWIIAAGIKIHKQQGELLNKHGKPLGHIDGIGEYDDEFFLVEVKSANNKAFNAMAKSGPPDYYYAQTQLYMHHSPQLSKNGRRLERCLFVVLNKDTSEMLATWIDYSAVYAASETDRMNNVIETESVPAPTKDYRCAMCDHQDVCAGKIPAVINCRTCANVSVIDGAFSCAHGSEVCGNYITHPQLMGLMGFDVVSADSQTMAIDYGAFVMAPEGVKVSGKNTMTALEFYTEKLISETEAPFIAEAALVK